MGLRPASTSGIGWPIPIPARWFDEWGSSIAVPGGIRLKGGSRGLMPSTFTAHLLVDTSVVDPGEAVFVRPRGVLGRDGHKWQPVFVQRVANGPAVRGSGGHGHSRVQIEFETALAFQTFIFAPKAACYVPRDRLFEPVTHIPNGKVPWGVSQVVQAPFAMPKLESCETFGTKSNMTVRSIGWFRQCRLVVVQGSPLPINVVITGIRKVIVLALHVPAKMSLAFKVLFAGWGEIGERGSRTWWIGGVIRPISLIVVVLIILVRGVVNFTRGSIQTFAILVCRVSFASAGKCFGPRVDLSNERGGTSSFLPSIDVVNDIRGRGTMVLNLFGVASFLFRLDLAGQT